MAKKRSSNAIGSALTFSRQHYWFFFAVFVISGLVGLYSLRQNNMTSIRLREKLLEVDKQNGDVETALRDLREHIYSHMNAGLSSETGLQHPIQLKYRYERLVTAEKERVSKGSEGVYSAAQAECERLYPQGQLQSNRVPCVQQYIASHPVSQQPIDDTLYKFNFVSPAWTFDIAGWSLLISLVSLIVFFVGLWLDRRFRHHLAT